MIRLLLSFWRPTRRNPWTVDLHHWRVDRRAGRDGGRG